MRIATMLLLAALIAMPGVTNAAPSTLKAKEAERTAALAELEALETRLNTQMTQYVDISRRIEVARLEFSDATTRVAEADVQLQQAKAALEDRVVQLYCGGRVGLIEVLFAAESIQDLMNRANYLTLVGRHDTRLIEEMRIARQQSEWEQKELFSRVDQLTQLQIEADTRRADIENAIDAQQLKATELGEDIARLMRLRAGSAPDGSFSPDTVISDANFRDVGSMTAADIQEFLDEQPGTLGSYSALDYDGRTKTAAQMIAEASTYWKISPKVILVKLQKEQSLLAKANPSQTAYDWAMGCGKADSRTYYEYQGFGKQIWWGAQKLDKNAQPWYPGIEMIINGSLVLPTNEATYSLYKYTPHLRGTTSFWMLYWRYFGDPLS
ncbi:MAG: hypothetical protein FD171_328 [Actinobacteria bacterium]|nr:MAG: hypothetical protein FD171_328 [Actinomycetota bacterium]